MSMTFNGTSGITFPDGTTQSTASNSIGFSQSWVDVTSSRSIGSTYTNNTGRPIMVSIYGGNTGATSYLTLSVGGIVVCRSQGDTTNGSAQTSMVSIVPNGITYQVNGTKNMNPANGAIWAELR